MKIQGPGGPGKPERPAGRKGPKTGDKKFDSVLKSASAGPPQKSGAVSAPPPVTQAHPAGEVGKPIRAKAILQVENAFSDLEFYVNTLANNDVPLSRLAPMSDALMERKNELVSMLPHIDDPEMSEIITQTAALIINENSRYYSS